MQIDQSAVSRTINNLFKTDALAGAHLPLKFLLDSFDLWVLISFEDSMNRTNVLLICIAFLLPVSGFPFLKNDPVNSRFLPQVVPPINSKSTSCTEANQNYGDKDFLWFRTFITACGITTLDQFVQKFADSPYRSIGGSAVFDSRSLQSASLRYPRIITSVTNTYFTFNGDPSDPSYNDLEMLSFNPSTKKFELQSITFDPLKGVQFSQVNPPKCLACHGDTPKPIWDTNNFWPGVYGSKLRIKEIDSTSTEGKAYNEFWKNREGTRYEWLYVPANTALNSGESWQLTINLLYSNLERIVREMRELPATYPFRYALMAAASSCSETHDIRDFIPAEVRKNLTSDYNFLLNDTKTKNDIYIVSKLERQRELCPDCPGTTFTQTSFRSPAALRYIYEGLGYSTSNWTTEFGSQSYGFNTVTNSIGDPTTSQELLPPYIMYEFMNQPIDKNFKTEYYTTSNRCAYLKEKSLSAWSTQ